MSLQKGHANEETSSVATMRLSEPKVKRKRSDSNNCHQCHRNDRERVERCTKCQKNFCISCMTKWYPGMEKASFRQACPHCLNICNCAACLQSDTTKTDMLPQELKLRTEDKIQFSRYIVKLLVPFLKQFVSEQNMERAEEAIKIQGLLLRAEVVAQVDNHSDPHVVSQKACSCLRSNQGSGCPTVADAGYAGLKHFQWHLKQGEPVLVSDVLSGTPGLSWEPMVLWRICRKSRTTNPHDQHFTVRNCINCCEERVEMLQFFKGYTEGLFDSEGRLQVLRLEEWPPSESFEERLPRHNAEFFKCLPFKHYTHPRAEMSLKIPEISLKTDLGPKMHIGYGAPQELGCCSVTKLQYTLSDRVNVLMHTAVISHDDEKLSTIESSRTHDRTSEEAREERQRFEDSEGGAVWDVFRRQDVHKLEEYLRKHSEEFKNISSQQEVPIHEKTFYLTVEHKRKLKQEYGIAPWTFVQRLGDAVFVPAGCIHQIRNLKSCTSMAANFVSPESVGECIRLAAKHQSLPHNNHFKDDKLEVKKITIQAISQAVEYLDSITPNTTSTSTHTPAPVVPAAAGHQTGANPPDFQSMRQHCEYMLVQLELHGHRMEPAVCIYLKREIEILLNKIIRKTEEGSTSL